MKGENNTTYSTTQEEEKEVSNSNNNNRRSGTGLGRGRLQQQFSVVRIVDHHGAATLIPSSNSRKS